MNVKCDFPVRKSGRDLVIAALEAIGQRLSPQALPPKPPYHIPVYLSQQQASSFRSLAEQHGLTIAECVERLAYAMYQAEKYGQQRRAVAEGATESDRLRNSLKEEIREAVNAGKIVIAEASTGLGKGRILGAAAAHILKSNAKNVVWAAAPTISVMLQLVAEFTKEAPELAGGTVLIGRQQFVSLRRLDELLAALKSANDPDLPSYEAPLRAWLDSGGRPHSPVARALAATVPGIAYLIEDIAEIAPAIHTPSIALDRADPAEPADAVITMMQDRAAEARLVYCTHAMALLVTKPIPKEDALPFTHLLLDEVHELESVAARLAGHEISLFRLATWLKAQQLTHAHEAIAAVGSLMDVLSRDDALDDGFVSRRDVINTVSESLRPVLNIVEKARKGDSVEREAFTRALRSVVDQTGGLGISFSPVRRYPSLLAGPRDVAPMLIGLWKRLKGAVGVSATIFVPAMNSSAGAEMSSGYVVSAKLNVPVDRLRVADTKTASWVTATPTLFVPTESAAARLCYPRPEEGQPDEETAPHNEHPNYTAWMRSVAEGVMLATGTAVGGTLVLCTAFRDIAAISARLELSLGKRLIVHRRGVSIQRQKSEFVALRRAGDRPVWLASGAAWTGLNLRDEDAEAASADTLLTDLVIVRAPLRMNRTSTHLFRCARNKQLAYWFERSETAIRLRQGAGRLMRREGVENRRLWVLDGRLFHRNGSQLQTLASVFRFYYKRRTFDLPLPAEA